MSGLLLMAGVLAIGGLLVGFIAGLLGIGGGAILVTMLYEVLGILGVDEAVRTHMAVGTSMAVILPTGIRAAVAHHKKGSVDIEVMKVMAPCLVFGVVLGTIIAKFADGSHLRVIYAMSSFMVGSYLLWSRKNPEFRLDWPGNYVTRIYSVFNGMLSTLMGIGGGSLTSGFMTFFGRGIHQAVGTASALGPIIALPAIIGFIWAGWQHPALPEYSVGYISLIGAICILPTSLLAAPFGVKAAHGLSRSSLELYFALFLLFVGFRFLLSVIL